MRFVVEEKGAQDKSVVGHTSGTETRRGTRTEKSHGVKENGPQPRGRLTRDRDSRDGWYERPGRWRPFQGSLPCLRSTTPRNPQRGTLECV